MLRNGKAATLTLAALFTAGCAQSDYVVSRDGQKRWQQVDEATIADAPQAAAPNILPETYFAAGQLFEAQGLLGKAIMQYRRAVAVNHHHVGAFHRLGVLLGAVGRHGEAAEALQRAVELRPNDAILRNNLGYEFVLQQRWEDAQRELRKAIELQPQFARAHVNLGMVLSQLNRFDEALASFQAVLPAPDAYYNLALMLRGRQRYQDAADALEHALSMAPHFSAATIQLEQLAKHLQPKVLPEPTTDAKTPSEVVPEDAERHAAAVDVQTPQAPEPAAARTDFATGDGTGAVEDYGWSDASDVVDQWMEQDDDPCDDDFIEDPLFAWFEDIFTFDDEDSFFEEPLFAGDSVDVAGPLRVAGQSEETPDYEPAYAEEPVGILFQWHDRWLIPADTPPARKTLGETIIFEEPTDDLSAPPGVDVVIPEEDAQAKEAKPMVSRTPQAAETHTFDVPQVEEPVMPSGVVDASVSGTPLARLLAVKSLDADLALVQQEIECWEELLAEQAEATRLAYEAAALEAPDALADTSAHDVTNIAETDMLDIETRETAHTETADAAIVQRPTLSSTVVGVSAPPTEIRHMVIKALEQDLTAVRREIECWEETLAEQAEARRLADLAADAMPGLAFVPVTDPEPHLYPPLPPVEPIYLRLLTMGTELLPTTTVDGDGNDAPFSPDPWPNHLVTSMPEMTTIVTLSSACETDRVEEGPFPIGEIWEGPLAQWAPMPPDAPRETPTRVTLGAGIDIAEHVAKEISSDWDVTFGDVQDLFSIVRNEMDCWEALESSRAARLAQSKSASH
ncbi:MAG: tetratricopeptide repeat protein [Planctomycetota bacterium]